MIHNIIHFLLVPYWHGIAVLAAWFIICAVMLANMKFTMRIPPCTAHRHAILRRCKAPYCGFCGEELLNDKKNKDEQTAAVEKAADESKEFSDPEAQVNDFDKAKAKKKKGKK
jgi:hypothetical protein